MGWRGVMGWWMNVTMIRIRIQTQSKTYFVFFRIFGILTSSFDFEVVFIPNSHLHPHPCLISEHQNKVSEVIMRICNNDKNTNTNSIQNLLRIFSYFFVFLVS